MDDEDEQVDPGWVPGELPDTLWFDLLNSMPFMLVLAYFVGTWLPSPF
jgi:hypothetical protein